MPIVFSRFGAGHLAVCGRRGQSFGIGLVAFVLPFQGDTPLLVVNPGRRSALPWADMCGPNGPSGIGRDLQLPVVEADQNAQRSNAHDWPVQPKSQRPRNGCTHSSRFGCFALPGLSFPF